MTTAHLPPFYENPAFWLYVFVWLPSALFVGLYWARSPWRSTLAGRGVMALGISILAVLTFVLIVLAAPIPPQIRDLVRTITMGAVGLAQWLMLRNLLTEQRRGRDRKR